MTPICHTELKKLTCLRPGLYLYAHVVQGGPLYDRGALEQGALNFSRQVQETRVELARIDER